MSYDVIPGATKEDVVRELLARFSPQDHKLCGESLWAVVQDLGEDLTEQPTIVCFRLQQFPDGWGHKQLPESIHPFYYDCPLRMLELARVSCRPWRAAVRAWHSQSSVE
jgi:hypothetical protein